MTYVIDHPLLVFLLSFFSLTLSAWIGSSISKRWRKLTDDIREDFGIIEAAVTLTLLSLLIGFSFSMAVDRYNQRTNYEEAEATPSAPNTFGSACCLPLMSRECAPCFRTTSISVSCSLPLANEPQIRQINAHTAKLQDELWSAVQASAATRTGPCRRPGGRRHERCVELAGLYAGCLVEPNPAFGLGTMVVIAIFCNVLIGYSARSP